MSRSNGVKTIHDVLGSLYAEMDAAWNSDAVSREQVHRWGRMIRDEMLKGLSRDDSERQEEHELAMRIARQPRVKMHLDMDFGYWWIEVTHIPAIGSFVIPFEDNSEIPWEWHFDCVKVEGHLWFVEKGLVCVLLSVDAEWDDKPEGFDEAMLRAGWKKGDAEAWS